MKADAHKRITSFKPPLRTLMGPGPSDVPQRVLNAMARPTIGHLDPAFVEMMEEMKTLLRYAFQTENELTFPISAPGSSPAAIFSAPSFTFSRAKAASSIWWSRATK